MKKRVVLVALAGALALGGCASVKKEFGALNECGVIGAVAGGAAAHALTGGASTAWQVTATVAGAGGGMVVANPLCPQRK